jgi:hypothetical protein
MRLFGFAVRRPSWETSDQVHHYTQSAAIEAEDNIDKESTVSQRQRRLTSRWIQVTLGSPAGT